MPGAVLSIVPGPPQQMSGAALQHGSTLFNGDPVNAVWVSSKQAVGPNIGGWKLTPQMSVDWTGAQLWACVDSGVTQPVLIQLSDDVQNINDPVGIAEAIALLGLPLTYLNEQLLAAAIAPSAVVTIPVTQYASIQVEAQIPNAGDLCGFTVTFYGDAALTRIVAQDFFTLGVETTGLTECIWEMPVRGPFVKFTAFSINTDNIDIFVNGTNRTVPGIRSIYRDLLPRGFEYTGAAVIGNFIKLPASDLLANYTTLNGAVDLSLTVAAGNPTGQLVMGWAAVNMTLEYIVLDPVPVGSTIHRINHPIVPTAWYWVPSASAAAVDVQLRLVPAGTQS